MNTNQTDVRDDVLSQYLGLMAEIKRREEVISGLFDGTCNAKYQIVNYEVMFFQLRKILELIVKAPMIINEAEYRDVAKSPESDWRISDIMKKLAQINPDYYPKPIEVRRVPGEMDHWITKESGYLTKDKLRNAYDHCNGFLHAENPLKAATETDFSAEWSFICTTIEEIHNLLGPHLAHPTKDGHLYYIGMHNPETGKPHGNIFAAVQ